MDSIKAYTSAELISLFNTVREQRLQILAEKDDRDAGVVQRALSKRAG